MANIILFIFVLAVSQGVLCQMNIPGVKSANSITSSLKAGLAGLEAGIDGFKSGLGGIRSGFEGLKSGVNNRLSSGVKPGLNSATLRGANFGGVSFKSGPGGANFGLSGVKTGVNSITSRFSAGNSGIAVNGPGNDDFGLNSVNSSLRKNSIPMQVYSTSPIIPYGVKAEVEATCNCGKQVNNFRSGLIVPNKNLLGRF